MTRSNRLVLVVCISLVLNMTGFLSVAAVLPELFDAFSMSETAAGWLTGSAFAAYAATVPLATALTDRIDAKPVVIGALLVGAASGIGFGLFADDLWSALGFRILAGIGFGAMHFPGLKMLADRLPAERIARGSGLYVSMFSLGGAASFAVSGVVIAFAPWPWVFIATGFCSALGALAVALWVPALPPPTDTGKGMPEFQPVLRNTEAMRYVLAYFGHLWEMFSFRNWYVVFLALSMGLAQNHAYQSWNVPLLAALTSLAAWPASLVVTELAVRFSREKVITATVSVSLVLSVVLAFSMHQSTPLLLFLMVLYSMSAFADSSAMAGGLLNVVDQKVRGAALALYALLGFCGGALGPAVVGWVMETAGGRESPLAWTAAWLTIGAGTLVVIFALNFARGRGRVN